MRIAIDFDGTFADVVAAKIIFARERFDIALEPNETWRADAIQRIGPLRYDRTLRDPFATARTLDTKPMPATSRTVVRLAINDPPDHKIRMGEDLKLPEHEVRFTLNGIEWPDYQPEFGSMGQLTTWEVENETHMDHPFHLHGHFFQVLSTKEEGGEWVDVPDDKLSWKDTVIVPQLGALRFSTKYESYPGKWMFHCHILEHAEKGMMSLLDLSP